MDRDMLQRFIEPIVLSVVARGDTYGYQLAKYVNEQTNGALELKEGTLYPALRRLEAEHLIEGFWGNEMDGPRRRYYRITKQGFAKLKSSRESWTNYQRILSMFLGEAFAL